MQKELRFPVGFLWGSSSSAHQTEGDNVNSDWWEWEQKGGGKEPSGVACDFYNRYEEDIKLATDLSQNAFRFSIEWARIEPKEGEFSEKETAHYRKILEELKKRNIKTFVTLHHFTNPIWFAKKGGWVNPKSPEIFCHYAKYCSDNFSDLIDFWITINEPTVYAGESYFLGIWPPQKRNIFKTIKVITNMIKAHNKSLVFLKKPAGIAHHVVRFDTDTKNPTDLFMARVLNTLFTDATLLLCSRRQDFIGLNYYSQFKIRGGKMSFDYSLGKTETSLSIAPEGLYKTLRALKKYKKPIFITENGCADSTDAIRQMYIKKHLEKTYEAIEKGVNVKGYFYWSLTDNFEWHLGFKPRFGLIEIDRDKKLQRKIRKSAAYYATICKKNSLIT